MPIDASQAFDFENTFWRNAVALPAQHRGLVQRRVEHRTELFQGDLGNSLATIGGNGCVMAHVAYSCDFRNFCQGEEVAINTDETTRSVNYGCGMQNMKQIHPGKTPIRRHFIVEWAKKRGLSQADIANELGVNKGNVSYWFNRGTVPSDQWIEPLAALLGTTRDGLFRHPDDDWIAEFFRMRSEEERLRAIQILENAFPLQKKAG